MFEIERRLQPRLTESPPAKLWGRPISRESSFSTILDNLSARGLHVRLEHPVAIFSPLLSFTSIAGIEVMESGVISRCSPTVLSGLA